MKRNSLILLVLVTCLLVFTGCRCEHAWEEADCDSPKTCTLCEETEGAPLGHSWQAATCTTAKTCEVCGTVNGAAIGHDWQAATCTVPETCAACGETQGEAPGHVWMDATTEAPKTCSTCQETEGERIITDPRFTTASASALFGDWAGELTMDGSALEIPEFTGVFVCTLTLELHNDGTTKIRAEANTAEFEAQLTDYMVDMLYSSLAENGLDQSAADEYMVEQFGMTVQAYSELTVSAIDLGSMIAEMEMDGVYYVEGNQIYTGYNWEAMDGCGFTLSGDTLTIEDMVFFGENALPLTRQS